MVRGKIFDSAQELMWVGFGARVLPIHPRGISLKDLTIERQDGVTQRAGLGTGFAANQNVLSAIHSRAG